MLIYLHQNTKYDNIRFKRAVNLEKKKKKIPNHSRLYDRLNGTITIVFFPHKKNKREIEEESVESINFQVAR